LLSVSSATAAACSPADMNPTQIKLMQVKLMQETKLIAVMEIKVPADKYASDGDPNTLEIVFLSKPEDGASRVSDDGEVIFLTKDATDDEQQALTMKAFDIRARRRLSCQ